jgi:hypothetical protein
VIESAPTGPFRLRRRSAAVAAALLAAGAGLPAACGSDEPDSTPAATEADAPADRFDEERAFRLIERQVAYGQRPAG